MAEVVYVTSPGKIKGFFEKLPEMGVPGKLTYQELAARGFTSSSDRAILPLLKALGITDPNGHPTARWQAYRDRRRGRQLLADWIREAYEGLFSIYPSAETATDQELRSWFSTKTKAGERVVVLAIATFKALSQLADFTKAEDGHPTGDDVSRALPAHQDALISSTVVGDSSKMMASQEPVERIYMPGDRRISILLPTELEEAEAHKIWEWINRLVKPSLEFMANVELASPNEKRAGATM